MGNAESGLGGRLSKTDVERLRKRFRRLMAPGSTTVAITAFQSMVELGGNPFIPRIFQLFDGDGDGCLTIEEFTKALEYFGQLDQIEEQYKFAFKIYDLDGDGLISSTELYNTLHQLMGMTLSDAQLEQVVHNTMAEYDQDGDNCLNLHEFKQLLSSTDLANKLALTM